MDETIQIIIDGAKVDMMCFNCGRGIKSYFDFPFLLEFDEGEPSSRVSPGEPGFVFLICNDCIDSWQKRKINLEVPE